MKYINVLVLASCIWLFSCSHAPTTRTLNRAEQLMLEAPDSAKQILNAIPRHNLKNRAQKARFALLYSQAMDKCYIDTDNDSLISVAVKYYSKQGSDHEKALAYYYESVMYRNAKNTDAQVESLVKAQKYVENTDDSYLKGLTYSKLAQLLYTQKQFDQSLSLFYQAAISFDKANSLRNKMNSLDSYGHALYQIGNIDEALYAKNEALKIAKSLNDNIKVVLLEIDILNISNDWDMGKFQNVKKYILENEHFFSKGEFYRHLGNLYELEGNIDSTKYYRIKYIENDDIRNMSYCGGLGSISNLCEQQGNIAEALKYSRMYAITKDSINNIERKNIIEDLEHKYKTKEILQEKVSLQKQNTLLIIISVLGVAILIVIIICIINYSKSTIVNQRTEYESYITQYDTQYSKLQEQYEKLSKNVGVYTNDSGEIGIKLIEALNNRLSSIRKLSELAYLYGETSPQKFYRKFQEHIIITKNRNDEFINEIIEVADILNDGVIEYLMRNYPDLSKFELSYCGLVSLGFTPDSIRILYNHTHIHSLYTIRARIKSKINLNSLKEFNRSLEDYINDLCNMLKTKQLN